MELSKIKRVFFVGIGGIGMSALARYFAKRGQVVCGYDKTKTKLTETLTSEGILITYLDEVSSLPGEFLDHQDDTLIVYTPAIPKDSKILNHFINKGFALKKRSEVLGIISKGMFCIAVAGTHGKTTTSSIVAHILKDTGYDCTAFLGGITSNYNSNVLFGENNVVVVEADEYDRSFLTLHPDVAVVTSMDADHLDIYGDKSHLEESFRLFSGQLKGEGTLYAHEGLPLENSISYAASSTATAKAENLRVEGSKFVFDYADAEQRIKDISLMLPGKHNVENTTVAIAIALQLGIDAEKVKQAVANFKGVKRRFEYIVNNASQIYIDDYAHHPEELRACFDAVRQLYPGKKLTVIFQPHLFTRTRDFADEFAKVLSTVDELMLLEIYPARELPIEGINAQFLLDKITLAEKKICEKDFVVQHVEHTKPELILTVGAGDIDTIIEPLKNTLNNA
ncbi:UDP-N-acetylmuramate--L-alanine ligase [Pedobacter alluvionis]|uniref:UDP-N-acetylmuramate--L-alanine ligase n=1 Tax=Pedobacter alluvionis TaxID=475253 RepID=A0A497YB76_9SPHI|nr:UDP-N-acetylmuramate--L-alanine ligase [Pedobacter alluvionis]RLJ79737.1 UDP-N-acetylmuramate--L-alanine ligase [Pedobacter alluvionis]TFB31057.1 UDP-N-acetylmuramate--L-alanine ligase [Pedobacter alluvionis]